MYLYIEYALYKFITITELVKDHRGAWYTNMAAVTS